MTSTQVVPRTVPHDKAAEAALLGAMLLSKGAVGVGLELVKAGDFYRPAHSYVFGAIASLSDRGEPVDAVTVRGELERKGELPEYVDPTLLIDLQNCTPLTAHAPQYAQIVVEMARRRCLISKADEVREAAFTEPHERLEALASQLVELYRAPPDDATSWTAVDLRPVMAGLEDGSLVRPTPTLGRRTDGVGLFYAGRVNGLFGDSGDGKTWVALLMAKQEIDAGNHVVMIDLEDEPVGTVGRLLELGLEAEAIERHFHYISPDEPFCTNQAQVAVFQLIEATSPTLAIIDSTGESMALDGINPNGDDEVARWGRQLPRALARLGPAVLPLDHVVKARDARGLYASGSQRKRALITGAAYLVEAQSEFGRGRRGVARLTTAKDRLGNHVRGAAAAEFVLDARENPYSASLEPMQSSSASPRFQPTRLMEDLSRVIEKTPGLSLRQVRVAVSGRAATKDQALGRLVEDGYVRVERGRSNAQLHHSIKPYRAAEGVDDAETF